MKTFLSISALAALVLWIWYYMDSNPAAVVTKKPPQTEAVAEPENVKDLQKPPSPVALENSYRPAVPDLVDLAESMRDEIPIAGEAGAQSFPTVSNWRKTDLPKGVGPFDTYALAAVADINSKNYRSTASSADNGDATASYLMYLLFATCASSPQTQAQLDYELEKIAREGQVFNDAAYVAGRAQVARESYEKCQDLAPDLSTEEMILEALDWLTISAEQGHLFAQIAYYNLARGLIDAGIDVFKHPEVLVDYRLRSARYLQVSLESGHPEAFSTMARALMEGVVFDRDPVASYAYFIAAEKANNGAIDQSVQHLESLEAELSLSEETRARNEGIRICRELC